MRLKLKSLFPIALLALLALPSVQAAPIVYQGNIVVGGPAVMGLTGPFGVFNPFDPPVNETFSQFWTFSGVANSKVSIRGTRLDNNLDPFLSLYRGTITPGTDDSAFNPFGSFDAITYLASADDEVDAPGPFGDPLLTITLTTTGVYTIAISGAASDCPGGTCPANGYPYSLSVTQVVPEPSTLPLLLLALAGTGWALRRRQLG